MGFIKNLFKKEEKIVEPVINPAEIVAQCEACKKPILINDRLRTFNKEKYHLKCFRNNMKLMRKQVFQN